ncbi:AAA family ATPase [Candidatus Latescibacterota bacterium]
MPKKNITIALSGKGGVGKTTTAALLIRALRDRKDGAVFGIDADPNSCLADYLGLTVDINLGDIREDIIKNISNIPHGMTKERWINYRVHECIVESTGVDVLEMGRPEGPGCYCYINNLIRGYEGEVTGNYKYTVIDNEAGMEHLSRRTSRTIDYLLIVSDLSNPGLKAAARINELSKKLDLVTKYTGLILNKADDELFEKRKDIIDATGLEIVGRIPSDPVLANFESDFASVLEIPVDSISLKAAEDIITNLKL